MANCEMEKATPDLKGELNSRRIALLVFAGATTCFSTGCGDKEPKPSFTGTLTNNDEVHAALKGIVQAADELTSNVEKFDTENWRDVVPKVRSAAENVTGAVIELGKALGYSDSN
jgi:hypothetical protein